LKGPLFPSCRPLIATVTHQTSLFLLLVWFFSFFRSSGGAFPGLSTRLTLPGSSPCWSDWDLPGWWTSPPRLVLFFPPPPPVNTALPAGRNLMPIHSSFPKTLGYELFPPSGFSGPSPLGSCDPLPQGRRSMISPPPPCLSSWIHFFSWVPLLSPFASKGHLYRFHAPTGCQTLTIFIPPSSLAPSLTGGVIRRSTRFCRAFLATTQLIFCSCLSARPDLPIPLFSFFGGQRFRAASSRIVFLYSSFPSPPVPLFFLRDIVQTHLIGFSR